MERVLNNIERRVLRKWVWWFLIPLGLVILNFFIIFPLFQGEYTQWLQSQEATPIAIAQSISENWPHFTWNPLWYNGQPSHIFYTPVFPFLELFFKGIFNFSFSQAYRIIVALSYILAPLTFYFLVRYLTKRKIAALIAALFFSLAPSVTYWIEDIGSIASNFSLAPWRFIVINYYGQGTHSLALVFIPLAGLCFLHTLRRANLKNILISTLLIGLIGLIDPFSLLALFLLLFTLLFSEVLLSDDTAQRRVRTSLLTLIISLGFLAFWYNWTFIKNFFSFNQGKEITQTYLGIIPYAILIIPWVIIMIFYIFGSRKKLQSLFIGVGWFTLNFIIIYAYYFWDKKIVLEANYYLPELDMAIALMVGVVIMMFYDWMGKLRHPHLAKVFMTWFSLAIILLIFYWTYPFISQAWRYTQPHQNIEKTSEYQIAHWFNQNTDIKNTRVFLTGNNIYWFNLFSKIPQWAGGWGNLTPNILREEITNHILTSSDGFQSTQLARAAFLPYLGVNSQDYLYPEKFKDLEKVYEYQNQVVYKVDLKNYNLIQKVDLKDLSQLKKISSISEEENFENYLTWLDKNNSQDNFNYSLINNDNILVRGEFKEGEGVLVKSNYNKGWKAKLDGESLKVVPDPMGFLVINPEKKGELEIELQYKKTWDQWLGYGITLATLILLIIHGLRLKTRESR